MKMNKKGFTLIEMLVVIAIIAVLVSIVIPVVTNSTEKAREAADAANIRSAIAEVTTAGLSGDTTGLEKVVTLTQKGKFDQNTDLKDIGGFPLSMFEGTETANKTSVTIKFDKTQNCVLVDGNKAPTSNTETTKCTTFTDSETDTDELCDTCGKALADHG